MVSARPIRIGVVTDRMDDARAQVIGGVESVVRPSAAVLALVHHRLNPWRGGVLGGLLSAGRLDGVVVLPVNSADTGESRLHELLPLLGSVPTVLVGPRHPHLPRVGVPDDTIAGTVLDHLVEDCGRRRLLLVSTPMQRDGVSRRRQAMEEAAAGRGVSMSTPPELQRCVDRHSARVVMADWLARRRGEAELGFDAVVCTADDVAVGVLDALDAHGVAVPGEVSVVGCGDTDVAWGTSPTLTSMDIALRQQGAAAGRYLLDRIAGRDVPTSGTVTRVDVDGLRIRSSSLPLHDADQLSAELPWTDDAAIVDRLLGREAPDPLQQDLETQVAARQQLRHATALTVLRRGPTAELTRLAGLGDDWQRLLRGELSHESRLALSRRLEEIVRSRPEEIWWRAWLEVLRSRLASQVPATADPVVPRLLSMTSSLTVERVLGDAREDRERQTHLMAAQVLELNQSLSGCTTVVGMNRALRTYLSRLGLRRFFVAIYERPIRLPADGTPSPAADERPSLRLVFEHGMGCGGAEAAVDEELLAGADVVTPSRLLPARLAAELDEGTFMVQGLFGDDGYYGLFGYEGSGRDRHVGEVMRLAMSRVLESRARTGDLEARSRELAGLVAARTHELELEVANRQQAQDELRAANDQLRSALLRDGLTGLYNRPALDEHLARAWARARRTGGVLSVLICDVDRFKLLNDVVGHLAGDECLRRVGRVLAGAGDRASDMVARYGGEEFVVVLDDTDLPGATRVAERLLDSMRAAALPHPGLGQGGLVSMSVGVASSSGLAGVAELLGAADRALYQAKDDGRDRVRVTRAPVSSGS
ncbi:GGDEF domain-containing protein [Nocardioides mangrovicus]|uniref:GGDEF domain-containing protein n=1 Tax=Nocardioides mangrovicus TaxID=2478913 RepID=A0A3L8P1R5_9ACTN|nr:GGDEF domain-containing protein [Nocardioides mangrovicus]RLV48549.1 GGDEF domain-containing protein [Nocardioides mangrovicus]